MQLLYTQEHLSCSHYQHGDKASMKVIRFTPNETISRIILNETIIFFILEGEATISYNEVSNKVVEAREAILIPPQTAYQISAQKDTVCISVAFSTQIQLCEIYSLEHLYPLSEKLKYEFTTLQFKDQVSDYLSLLKQYLDDGINCIHLLQLKTRELFYLLRAYYPKEDLALFFHPILNKDIFFKSFVLNNYLSVKNVRELAQIANYSTSGFIKRFVRTFNESPYKWMERNKGDRILHDIHKGEKPFKEIAMEYNFSSMPHFIKFCKRQYNATPGEIRKKKR